jgi:hypothetical protein
MTKNTTSDCLGVSKSLTSSPSTELGSHMNEQIIAVHSCMCEFEFPEAIFLVECDPSMNKL